MLCIRTPETKLLLDLIHSAIIWLLVFRCEFCDAKSSNVNIRINQPTNPLTIFTYNSRSNSLSLSQSFSRHSLTVKSFKLEKLFDQDLCAMQMTYAYLTNVAIIMREAILTSEQIKRICSQERTKHMHTAQAKKNTRTLHRGRQREQKRH